MDRERWVNEGSLILGWLERHPEERTLILWQAAQEEWPPPVGFAASTEAAAVTLQAHRDHLQRFMAAAHFGACARCYVPVVYLPDLLTVLAWPEMVRHRCGGVAGDTHRDRPRAAVTATTTPRGPSLPPAGSTPARSTNARVAQTAEHPARNGEVAGSMPAAGPTPPQGKRALLR